MSGPMIRFFRSSLHLCTVEVERDETILDAARRVEITIPSNCKSGTCGTCMMRLVSGNVTGLDPIPTALDEEWLADGAILSCISQIIGTCEIDVVPPL